MILTAQQDVNSGRVYAYAWLLKAGKENNCGNIVAEKNTEEEFNRIDRAFVEAIYDFLKTISESEDQKKRKLQCFSGSGNGCFSQSGMQR